MHLQTIGKQLMDYKVQKSQNTRLRRVEEWNTIAEKLVNDELSSLKLSSLDSDNTEIYDIPRDVETIDSDSTELYEIDEQIIGTITYSTAKLLFKCPMKSCKIRCETRKKISDHYR